ncbi:hypothetical protein BDY24DRAFT_394313 [Mrakia frigida]|uniref:Zn(II)2Cys6 transcription factor n=1 Tax=Mrakia frigida TaxID=29902 RepID=UPI003FCC1041
MPKDATQTYQPPPLTTTSQEPVGVPIPPVLKRNNACLACRKRKLRCSADRPACTTCLRSHAHIMKHIKPGQIAPTLHCEYEDLSDLPTPSTGGKPKGGKKVDKLETRVQQLEGLLRQVVGSAVVDAVGSGGTWNAQAGPSNFVPSYSPGPQSPFPPSSYNSGPIPPPFYHHPSPTAGLDLLASSSTAPTSSSSFGHLDQQQQQQQEQRPQPSHSPSFPFPPSNGHQQQQQHQQTSQSTFPIPLSNGHPHLQRGSPGSITDYHSPPDFPNSSNSQSQPPPPPPRISSQSEQATGRPFQTNSQASRPLSRKFNTFPPSETSPSSFGPSATTPTPSSNLRESHSREETPAHDDQILDLLWPGYPPHLPSPGFLQHVVEVYFNAVPMSNYLLNRTRFVTRMALPPTHELFPHPAVLHSICAIAARYTSLPLHAPADVIRDAPLSKKARSKRSRLDEGSKPTKDGLTAPIDDEDDFGAIHAQWTKIYFEQSVKNPDEWLDLTLAAVLLGGYMHQHARWVEGWTWIGQATRLAIPLGLHAFQNPTTSADDKTRVNRLYLIPSGDPSDEIDRVQRTNLWWMLYAHDTFASTTSGWPASIPVPDMTIGLPIYSASQIPSTVLGPTQNGYSPDLFSHHPPVHRNVMSLMMKAALLVRKVNDLSRKLDAMGCEDFRQQLEFQELDALITAFQQSFPAEFRDISPPTQGDQSVQSLNPELLHAHCLPWLAILCLHSSSSDPSDPFCPSSIRIREATSALLDRLWVISNTPFDFALLHPFTVFIWFTAAKSLLPFAEEARDRSDFQRAASLRSEVDVFRSAILIIGQKLPIGLRTVKMLDHLIEVVDKRGAAPASAPTDLVAPKSLVLKVAPTWIGADVIDKTLEQ